MMAQTQRKCFQRNKNNNNSNLIVVHEGSNSDSSNENEGDINDGEKDEQSEAAARVRKQLAALFGDSSSSSSNENSENDDSSSSTAMTNDAASATVVDVDALMDPSNERDIADLIPKQPPLTAAERDRRLTEIALLEQLTDSDEALEHLWELWFSERGASAKSRLEQADQALARGQTLAAEKMLRDMIVEYGVYWVEPLNRLATLLYMDGRLQASHQLCLVVLHLRPYHFGALSGIVAVSIGLGKREEARSWAEKRLPSRVASTSFPPFAENNGPVNPRRTEWVQKAVRQAQEALSRLDYQTQKDFGKPEAYYKKSKANSTSPPQQEPQKQQPTNQKETPLPPASQTFDSYDENAWQ